MKWKNWAICRVMSVDLLCGGYHEFLKLHPSQVMSINSIKPYACLAIFVLTCFDEIHDAEHLSKWFASIYISYYYCKMTLGGMYPVCIFTFQTGCRVNT